MPTDINDNLMGNRPPRTKRMTHWKSWMILLVLPLMLAFPQHPEAGMRQGPVRVLVINSYHPGFPTFFQQIAGIRSVLDEKNVLLDVEFMDSKRFPGREQRERFLKELSRKLPLSGPYDIVVTSDDNALTFALNHGEELFKGTPVVFLGVNDRTLALAQNDNPLVTGVVEAVSMKDTLALMARLHPDATEIVAIVDDTPSGLGDLKTFYDAGNSVALPLSHISMANVTLAAFTDRLKSMDSGKLMLLLSAYRDAEGELFRFDESLSLIRTNLNRPLYHLWEHGLGEGILGGRLISHVEQGKVAAKMVEAILSGKPVSEIPVVEASPNIYTFDFDELARFGISPSELPKGSVVINKPASLVERHETLLVTLASVILGLLLGVLLLILHVRSLQHNRQALKASEEKYRNFFDNNAPTIVIDKMAGIIVDANPSACRYYGYDIEEMRGRKTDTINILPESDSQKAMDQECGKKGHCFFKHRLASGEIRDVEVYTSSINTDGARLLYATVYDITDRLEAEKQLTERERYHRSITDATYDHILILDRSHTILDVNDRSLKRIGGSRSEAIGRKCYEALHGFNSPCCNNDVPCRFDEVLKTGEPVSRTQQHIDRDGNEAWLEVLLSPLKTSDGEITKVISASRDITKLKTYEQEKSRLEGRLQHAEKMETIGTLAGGIAHDFNNILFPIIGFSEMGANISAEKKTERRYFEGILKAAFRARDLVQQILTFSREGGEKKGPMRLQPVVEEALRLIRASLPSTIRITREIEKSCGLVMAEPTRIHQIVMNLATNAAHAMEHSGGELGVFLSEVETDGHGGGHPGRFLKLSFVDTGVGMTDLVQKRIFEPYFTTKGVGKGTGMGLSMVHGIVQGYDGHITVSSKLGEGTRFDLFFPLIATETTAPDPSGLAAIPGGTERILLVDDEKMLLDMEKETLTHLGYSVTTSLSGPGALEVFRNTPESFDLVITDRTMPDMPGERLAEALLKIRPDIPVILCTGFSDSETAVALKKSGISELLRKPVSRCKLAQTLRKVLDAR